MGLKPVGDSSGGEGDSAAVSGGDARVQPPVRPWPEYFGDWTPPAAVVELAKYWRGKPVEFRKTADGGAGWRWDPEWAARYPQACHDFLTLGQAGDVWKWLDEHAADVVTSRNFLFIWG